jgi:uncharacterized protein (TIGR03382 family)
MDPLEGDFAFVYRICESDFPEALGGVDGGVHAVSIRATLPGSDLSLTTPAVTFQLECPGEPLDPNPDAVTDTVDGGCSTTAATSPWLVLLVGFGLRRRRRAQTSCQ